MNLDNFDWGWMDQSDEGRIHKQHITSETFETKMYEKVFEVEPGDIVLDVGASVGSFTYSILDKKPKHVYCVEPSELEFPTLIKNTLGYPVTPILKGISDTNTYVEADYLYDEKTKMEGITFKKLRELYNLETIDFLKTDCEGGEYDIFNDDNIEYLKNNVKKIVGEWHLRSPELKVKFLNFRDKYLTQFNNIEVLSIDNVNIKWDLWNDHFIEYYGEVLIYIDNR
jgi:FkbM family methyltransferase